MQINDNLFVKNLQTLAYMNYFSYLCGRKGFVHK